VECDIHKTNQQQRQTSLDRLKTTFGELKSSQRCTACASDSLDQRCSSSWSQNRRRGRSLHSEHHHVSCQTLTNHRHYRKMSNNFKHTDVIATAQRLSKKQQILQQKKCRFGFPRPARSTISMNNIIDCLANNRSKQPRKRLYRLPRNKNETHINDYNPALLLANRGNVDVQYIGHLGSRLPFYITDYMTKHERAVQDNLWHEIFLSTKSPGSNAMSFALQFVKSRQVRAIEAADRLLGHKLFSKSRQHRFADLQLPNQTKQMLKKVQDIKKLLDTNSDSQDIFCIHWVLDVYPNRPNELEEVSFYEIMSCYEKKKLPPNSTKPLTLKNLPYYLWRRQAKPYIITQQTVNPHQSEEKKEKNITTIF